MKQKLSVIKAKYQSVACFQLLFRAEFYCYEGRKSGKIPGAAGVWGVSAGSPEVVREGN